MAKSAGADSTSLVSRQIVVEGDISGDENLHVDGHVKGTIRLTGDLFIGASGVVDAEVDARNVIIQGTLSGKVIARNQLEIKPSGRLMGDCSAVCIEIQEGAVFEGTSRMLTGVSAASSTTTLFPVSKIG